MIVFENVWIRVELPPTYRDVLKRHGGWFGLGLVFLIAGGLTGRIMPYLPPCIFHKLAGVSCPFCGLTTALYLLSCGQIERAAQISPICLVLVAAVVLLMAWNGLALLTGRIIQRGSWLQLSGKKPLCLACAIAVAILGNWIYRLRQGL